MPEPKAYLNGHWVTAAKAVLGVNDGGFLQGTTVAEQLRTFGGQLFRLDAHVERLMRSLAIVEFEPGLNAREFCDIAQELAEANHALLTPGDDLGLSMFVTPGPYPAMTVAPDRGATVCMHTFPLRFALWADKYTSGESLATTDVVQVPGNCWPPELKCRSRMHYYLADRQARFHHPGSRALMLDQDGFVVEATTANIVIFEKGQGLVTPPAHKILPGISMATLEDLADDLDIACGERDLTPADVLAADEVFLTSTSPCLLSVVRLNGEPVGSGKPGPMAARFLSGWSGLVGLDIVEQARRFSAR